MNKTILIFLILFSLTFPPLAYADNYALIIGGLAQDKLFYDSFWNAATGLYNILSTKYGYASENIIFLFEHEGKESGLVDGISAKENVQNAFSQLAAKVKSKDKVVIFMVGHATSNGEIIKFNLPQRDLLDSEYADLFNQIKCDNMIIILAFPHSGAFIKYLSKPGRVIITSSSAREGYDGEFSRIFIESLAAGKTDTDGKSSLLDVFLYTKKKIEEWYETDGSVQSEHPHLDDDGDGVGSWDQVPNSDDGPLANETFFGDVVKTVVAETEPDVEYHVSAEDDTDISEILKNAPNADDYPAANAVVLLDTETLDINEDISYEYSNHRIVKIFNEKGQKFGQVDIPYTVGNDDIEIHHAWTILPDGRVVELEESNILRNIPPPEALKAGLFVAARLMRIQMPQMTDNCVIDYAYSVNRKGHIMKGEYWRQTNFQTSEPILKYRFTIHAPKKMEFLYHVSGINLQPKITETKYTRVYEFEASDIPPIKEEKFMPTLQDLEYSITISSLKSWNQLARWYYTLIREQDHITPEIQKKTGQLLFGAKDRREKIRRLYEYVAENILYIGIELGIWAIKPHPAELVFKEKYGDCKDKTILLNTMLKAAGIKSYPVLIASGDSSRVIQEVPSLSYFNHMILVVEADEKGDLIWLDPTVETAAFGYLPTGDQNRLAYILVDEENSYLAKSLVLPAEKNVKRVEMEIEVNPDLSISVREELLLSGSFNAEWRAKLKNSDPENLAERLRELAEMDTRAKMGKFKISDLNNMDEQLRITINYDCDDYLTPPLTGGLGGITPVGDAYRLKLPIAEHPYADLLSENTRNYPVAIGKNFTLEHEIQVKIPKTFTIQSVPEDAAIKTDFGETSVKYEQTKDKVIMTQKFVLHQPIISVQQVPQLKKLVSLASNEKYIMIVNR
ncbi:DUF3857 domain-containing protein [Candidatus Poribacteria bacterium]|nr:DUF3857 domain-containing protein [Candidatus Poribacteria bacterium]